MKVYVIKNEKGEYMTETRDFINSIWQATLFNDYECALAHTPSDCKVCECIFMEKESLGSYTKQIRRELINRIKEMSRLDFYYEFDGFENINGEKYTIKDYQLDEIQGE